VKASAEARNVPLTEPAGIVSEAGTVRLAELEVRPMVPPLDPLRTTVQVLDAPGARDAGLHAIELIELPAGLTLTAPPVLVIVTALPVIVAPKLPVSAMGTLAAPEGVTFTVATTPLEMGVECIPHAMHV
jgi:hypothetical protein